MEKNKLLERKLFWVTMQQNLTIRSAPLVLPALCLLLQSIATCYILHTRIYVHKIKYKFTVSTVSVFVMCVFILYSPSSIYKAMMTSNLIFNSMGGRQVRPVCNICVNMSITKRRCILYVHITHMLYMCVS